MNGDPVVQKAATFEAIRELIAILRGRYKRPPVPLCRICGAAMELGAIHGPTREWYCGSKAANSRGVTERKARDTADRHYIESLFVETCLSDPQVLKLCDFAENALKAETHWGAI